MVQLKHMNPLSWSRAVSVSSRDVFLCTFQFTEITTRKYNDFPDQWSRTASIRLHSAQQSIYVPLHKEVRRKNFKQKKCVECTQKNLVENSTTLLVASEKPLTPMLTKIKQFFSLSRIFITLTLYRKYRRWSENLVSLIKLVEFSTEKICMCARVQSQTYRPTAFQAVIGMHNIFVTQVGQMELKRK